jgi:hypothetical protein
VVQLGFESFALAVGAGKDKIILLVIDRAGWHMSDKVVVPEGHISRTAPALFA